MLLNYKKLEGNNDMEWIIIVISLVTIILLKIGLNVHFNDIKKIKNIGEDKELKKIADKFPENKEICEEILKKLNNKNIKIEESSDTKSSFYIVIGNKIVIANIKDTFSRIQTSAHECLHSIQNRNILLFNFSLGAEALFWSKKIIEKLSFLNFFSTASSLSKSTVSLFRPLNRKYICFFDFNHQNNVQNFVPNSSKHHQMNYTKHYQKDN